MHKKAAICIFARAPEPGKVKTRLIGLLRPDEAAELYCAFLEAICFTAGRFRGRADIFLACLAFHEPGKPVDRLFRNCICFQLHNTFG